MAAQGGGVASVRKAGRRSEASLVRPVGVSYVDQAISSLDYCWVGELLPDLRHAAGSMSSANLGHQAVSAGPAGRWGWMPILWARLGVVLKSHDRGPGLSVVA